MTEIPEPLLKRAQEAGMDLVEVAPTARPPVCKIMDYGKWRYQQQKKEDKSRASSKGGRLKMLNIDTIRIGDHDLQIKINHARDFLKEGNKVQFTLQFESLAETPDEDADETEAETDKPPAGKRRTPQRQEPNATSVPASPLPAAAAPKGPTDPDKPTDKGGAEVVRLDRFRKK